MLLGPLLFANCYLLPFQIRPQITLCLPLHAGVFERRQPPLRCAIVFELSMLHGSVFALVDIAQRDLIALVFGH